MAVQKSGTTLLARITRLEELSVQIHHVLAELQNSIASHLSVAAKMHFDFPGQLKDLDARMKALEDHHD